jgi:Holliday junction resolvasome RuvABC endonuclease subunit
MLLIATDVGRANTGLVIYDTEDKDVILNRTISLQLAKMREQSRNINPSAWRLSKLQTEYTTAILSKYTISDELNAVGVVEGYAYGDANMTLEDMRNIDRASLELAECHGIVYSTLAMLKIPFYVIAPTQMKLFVGGDGHCEKTDIIKAMHNQYGVNLKTDHEYDALGLIHMLRYLVAYIRNSDALPECYEKRVCEQLVYDTRFVGITSSITAVVKLKLL